MKHVRRIIFGSLLAVAISMVCKAESNSTGAQILLPQATTPFQALGASNGSGHRVVLTNGCQVAQSAENESGARVLMGIVMLQQVATGNAAEAVWIQYH